jgi:predicted nuclease of predicted toxin-antitoxin system
MAKRDLLFDENLSIAPKTLSGQLCQLLTSRGWTCHSVHDFPQLTGHADEDVIAFAKQQEWSLVTLDKRLAYLAVKNRVKIYLVLHEKQVGEKGDTEELTVVHLDPFAEVQGRTTYEARLAQSKRE